MINDILVRILDKILALNVLLSKSEKSVIFKNMCIKREYGNIEKKCVCSAKGYKDIKRLYTCYKKMLEVLESYTYYDKGYRSNGRLYLHN